MENFIFYLLFLAFFVGISECSSAHRLSNTDQMMEVRKFHEQMRKQRARVAQALELYYQRSRLRSPVSSETTTTHASLYHDPYLSNSEAMEEIEYHRKYGGGFEDYDNHFERDHESDGAHSTRDEDLHDHRTDDIRYL